MLYFLHFRFDPMTLCLYRDAVQVPLRPKVAQLLAYFLTHPNQVVARETLLSSLWQHGEFRETALTQSITELRQALSDSPQNPTFIKTIPQQGYLWICPVEQPHSKSLISHVTKLGKKATILLTAVGLTAIVSTVSLYFLSAPKPVSSKASVTLPTLIIPPMANETGVQANAWWGYALEAALRQQLQSSYHLVPKSQYPELSDSDKTKKLTLSLKPLQQRFLLTASLASERTELIVEQLDENFTAIAMQVITQLALKTEAIDMAPFNRGMRDYYRGVQALNEQGPKLAKAYFEAAVMQMPDHIESQLELAQICWWLGDIQSAHKQFEHISLSTASIATQARYHLYYGEFLKATGQAQQALQQAKLALDVAQQSQQVELIASAYQLQADAYWSLQRWDEYKQAMNSAHVLVGSRSFAYSEAQRSFYLANPPAAGPIEKTLLNLEKSKPVLAQAITYYQQTAQKLSLIKALFAYGQNYLVPVSESEPSLLNALELAQQGGYHHLEMQVLTYLGFFYIQLHQGEKALDYLKQITPEPRFAPSYEQQQLLIGMAQMDIALQTGDEEAMQSAILQYQTLLKSNDTSVVTQANVKLLLSWTLIKAGELESAEQLSLEAMQAYQTLQLQEVETYALYTQMYIHLLNDEPQQALDIISSQQHPSSHLLLLYGAVAADMAKEEALQQDFSDKLTELENSQLLQLQLQQLRQQSRIDKRFIAELIDAPYSVYCQSKWTIN
ncbi:winged helix-turn-helix domain-containing protein [Pseudoalteromonas sp. McH1-7]|uniref:winged helix-turn-helix domain-containing protein n=1 Tax=Pseudoalteromonas sp. McH1-7 TaxID=2745574 RepID=UPI001590E9AA|nr:winged helix-turn-helix domain-containing protein [Pseudoalteromonas sp. McH1-7]